MSKDYLFNVGRACGNSIIASTHYWHIIHQYARWEVQEQQLWWKKTHSCLTTQSHTHWHVAQQKEKARQRSSVDCSCSGNLWNFKLNWAIKWKSYLCGYSPRLHFCLTKNANYVYGCVYLRACVCFRAGRDHPPHVHTHTHTNSATQPSVLHPCPWPSPCTWLILLYSTLCIKVHFRKVSKGVVQAGIERPPPLLLRSFCGLKASFLLVSSH